MHERFVLFRFYVLIHNALYTTRILIIIVMMTMPLCPLLTHIPGAVLVCTFQCSYVIQYSYVPFTSRRGSACMYISVPLYNNTIWLCPIHLWRRGSSACMYISVPLCNTVSLIYSESIPELNCAYANRLQCDLCNAVFVCLMLAIGQNIEIEGIFMEASISFPIICTHIHLETLPRIPSVDTC